MKRIFTLGLIVIGSIGFLRAQVNLDQGLVACYLLDGSFADSTSNALDLTPSGSPIGATDRFGILPGAYLFDASNPDYLTAALDSRLAPEELTLAAWANLVDPVTDQKIAGRAGVGAGGYLMGVDTNMIDAEIWDLVTTHFRLKGGYVPANAWTHLAISFKMNDYLKIYVNGMPVDSMASGAYGAGTSSTFTFTVAGAPWQPTALNVNGSIDDIFLYERALNSDEIMALYSFITGTIDGHSSVNLGKVYPVPASNDFLNIEFSNHIKGDVLVRITDDSGRTVYEKNYTDPSKASIQIDNLKGGFYTMSFFNGGKSENHRIVIN